MNIFGDGGNLNIIDHDFYVSNLLSLDSLNKIFIHSADRDIMYLGRHLATTDFT
jgi:hypothetical protein